MALDFVYQTTLNHGSDTITASVTISTGDDKVYAELPVAAATTVNYTGAAGDPADVKAVVIKADVAMTLTINYSAGADDVFSLVAGEPLAWNTKSLLTSPFVNANPIVSMDFNNAGATDGTAYVLISRDSST